MRAAALLVALIALSAAVAAAQPQATTAELVGSRLVVAMRGTSPSPELRERVRRGQLAGVILFARNATSISQLRSLTGELQRAARAGARQPLLVCVDQEGGAVRRLGWAPPRPSASTLGGSTAEAVRRAGRATGEALRSAGVNCNLAPVGDVPTPESFLRSRAFAADPRRVGTSAVAFAAGLASAGVAAAAKHFPGIGRAPVSTDGAIVRIAASRQALERDLAPFRRLVRARVPLVMLANASYPALDRAPAAWSRAITEQLLRAELGFDGVTITDSLDGAAAARGWVTPQAAVLSARAGVDLLLVTGSEATSAWVFTTLLREARTGRLALAELQRSHRRVAALRARLAD